MNQFFITILFLFISVPTLACTVPNSGPEFDKHIKVEKISKGRNLFRVVVSKEVEGLKYGAYISVEYYKANSEFRSGEYSKKIRSEEKGANYVATFKLAKIEGYVPYVEVFWPPEQCCLCGAYGYSEDIILE